MTREDMIKALGELMAGLAVPISLGVPLGKAKAAWTELHSGLRGFGWATAEDYSQAMEKVITQ